MARSPRRRIPFASVIGELTVLRDPVGLRENLRRFDTSHGCQNHTPLPSAASSTKTPRPAHVLPTEIPAKAFKRRSSARRLVAHGNPPCDPSRARRCRVHRIPHPTSVTIAIRPSEWDGMRGVVRLIWGNREEEYSFGRDWTGQIKLTSLEKFVRPRTGGSLPQLRPTY